MDRTDLSPDSAATASCELVEVTPVAVASVQSSDMVAKLITLTEQIAQLQQSLEQLASPQTGVNDSIIKELHNQLQESKAGVHWKILRTVLVDLVKLYDDVTRLTDKVAVDPSVAASGLLEIRQDLEDTLYRQGFSPFQVAGEDFDAKRQLPVSTQESPSPEQVGKIASRTAVGFASDDRMLRPEKVIVYIAPKTS